MILPLLIMDKLNWNDIPFPGLLNELIEWSEDHSKKLFRSKIIRIYTKCLFRNKLQLAVKIATKYRKELTNELRSDMSIAMQYSLFAHNITKKK